MIKSHIIVKRPKGMGKRMDKTQDTIELLRTYGQEHVIQLIEQLEGKEKEELIEQINKIDFHQIMELYDTTKKELEIKENKIENISYLDKAKLSKEQKEEFDTLGEMAIRKGEYAVVTMAGGQGTRLRTQWTQRNLSIRRLWKRKILI